MSERYVVWVGETAVARTLTYESAQRLCDFVTQYDTRDVVISETPERLAKRFHWSSRSGDVLRLLEHGEVYSIHAMIPLLAPHSNRCHYEACKRLMKTGMIEARRWSKAGYRHMTITPRGRAVLAVWRKGGA